MKLVQFSSLRSDILEWEGTFRVNFQVKDFMEQYVLFYSLNRLTYLAAYMGKASHSDLAMSKTLDLGDSVNLKEKSVGIVREYGTR